MVRCRGTVARPLPEVFENVLQIACSGYDDADIDDTQVEKKPEVVEISIIEGILVVPFDFHPNASFEAVNALGWAFILMAVHFDSGVELLFLPAKIVEASIQLFRYW